MKTRRRRFLSGIGKCGDKPVTILDLDRLLSVTEVEQAAQAAKSN